MTTDQSNTPKKEKREPKFARSAKPLCPAKNFGEYLFWSYANLQLLCAALNMGKEKYDRSCYMIRSTVRKEWPPLNILIHYLKNIYLYSIENGLMDKHAEELDGMDLPFKWQYIPLDYPQPEVYM